MDQHIPGEGIGGNLFHPGNLLEKVLKFPGPNGRPFNLGKFDPQSPFQSVNIGGSYDIHGNHPLY